MNSWCLCSEGGPIHRCPPAAQSLDRCARAFSAADICYTHTRTPVHTHGILSSAQGSGCIINDRMEGSRTLSPPETTLSHGTVGSLAFRVCPLFLILRVGLCRGTFEGQGGWLFFIVAVLRSLLSMVSFLQFSLQGLVTFATLTTCARLLVALAAGLLAFVHLPVLQEV